jgi:hypothetical protein
LVEAVPHAGSTAANWDAGVPATGQHLCVPSGVTGAITYTAGTTSIASLRSPTARLQLSGGSLTVATGTDASDLSGGVSLTTGTLTLNAPATIGDLAQGSGTLAGTGALALSGPGPYTWSGGTWSGTGVPTLAAGRTLTVSGAATKRLGKGLVNEGTITWTGGTLALAGATLRNGTAATSTPGLLDIAGDLSLTRVSGTTGLLNQFGTVRKSAGTGAGALLATNVTFTNQAAVEVTSGVLRLGGTGSHTGSVALDPGTTLELVSTTQTFSAGSSVSGSAGTVRVAGGGLTMAGAYAPGLTEITAGTATFNAATALSALTMSGGTLAGTGALALSGPGPYTWSGGTWSGTGVPTLAAGRTLTVSGAATKTLGKGLVNEGTITWTGGTLALAGAITFRNGTAATSTPGLLDIAGDLTMSVAAGSPGFLNQLGTLTKSAGTGAGATIAPSFTNDATTSVTSGTLTLSALTNYSAGSRTLTGGTYSATGATLRVSGLDVGTLAAAVEIDGATAGLTDTDGLAGLRGLAAISATGSLALDGHGLTSSVAIVNDGAVDVGPGATLEGTGGYTQASGATTLSAVSAQLGAPGGQVTVTGASAVSGGVVRPGGAAVGDLSVSGPYGQTGPGRIEVDVDGIAPGTFDRLIVTGAVSVGGGLDILRDPGFDPADGDENAIISGASVAGAFADVTGRGLPGGGTYGVEYRPTSVVLVARPPEVLTVSVPDSISLGTVLPGAAGEALDRPLSVLALNGDGYTLTAATSPVAGFDPLGLSLRTDAPPGTTVTPPFGAFTALGAAPQPFGSRASGDSPPAGDAWELDVRGDAIPWVAAGTSLRVRVTFTAVSP